MRRSPINRSFGQKDKLQLVPVRRGKMPRTSIDGMISIIDLHETPNQDFLDGFIEIYNKTFTDLREREDPAEWPNRMWRDAPIPQPRTHLLVALSTNSGCVVGGLVFEHYRSSHCGLLTYLVVEPSWRRKGIARSLVKRALSTLIREERATGGELRGAFCETENPQLVVDGIGTISTCDRLRAVLSLGARVIGLKYVQPGLVGGAGPCDHLLLLAFDLDKCLKVSIDGPPPVSISGRTIYDFLHEFYRALGISHPEEDQSFSRMARHLRDELTLYDPRERPALNLKEVAVCLHYIPQWHSAPEQVLPYPNCPIFQSMELDLMSYGYQIQRLLGSQCEMAESIPVEIRFPEFIVYHTEGRDMLLLPTRRICHAQALVSSTLFLISGIRIWHVALAPQKEEDFSEYDIIKLIHLYDGRTENTGLATKVKFRVGTGGHKEREITVEELLPELLGMMPRKPAVCRPKAGTVQIITGEQGTRYSAELSETMDAIQVARTRDGKQAHADIVRWMSDRTHQGKALLALCGILTGIFDFVEVDEEEVLDTMEPTFASPGSLIRIHRCTMVSIAQKDRAMVEMKNHIGISPYLLLPHAALLHNEILIEDSESALSATTAKRKVHLRKQESALRRTQRNLDRLYLPNVFNYVTEKTLFTQGAEGRGTNERLTAARARLQELDSQVKAAWEHKHDHGQMRIAALLAVFTVIGLRDVFFDILKGTVLQPFSWWVLCGLAALVVLLYVLWGVKRSQ